MPYLLNTGNLFAKNKNGLNIFGLFIGIFAATSAIAANKFDGIKYGTPEDPFWLQIKGALILDQRFFLGSKGTNDKDKLTNSAYIKDLSLNFEGGIGSNVTVSIGLGFEPTESKVNVMDAYLTYKGFKHFGDNFQVSIGKVNPTFCLENHSSGKWIPFLERSSVTNAFRPNPGLGVSINKWQKDYSMNASITQPAPGEKQVDARGNEYTQKKSDRWQYNARLTKAHFFGSNNLIQLGVFGNYKDDGGSGIKFKTSPEFKTRYATDGYLNTTAIAKDPADSTKTINTLILSKQHYSIGTEILYQNGPLSLEAEYQLTRVNRVKGSDPGQGENLKFHGYRSNINYVLTGESRKFKNSNGTLGQVIPNNESGAWEVSARYDYLNLNHKDIKGGCGHHTGVATTWYINHNFATTFEYVHSNLRKRGTLEKVKINTVGARLQLVF